MRPLRFAGPSAAAVAIGARAETETVGGYMWTCRINGGTAEFLV